MFRQVLISSKEQKNSLIHFLGSYFVFILEFSEIVFHVPGVNLVAFIHSLSHIIFFAYYCIFYSKGD